MKKILLFSLVGALMVLMGNQRVEAQLLYANSTDTFLHIVDLSDGSSTQLFDLGDGPTGLAVDDVNEIIYWSNGANTFSTTYDGLTTVDLGPQAPGLFGGLAFDAANGVLYGTNNGDDLFTVDTTTGVQTTIGVIADPVGGGILTLGGLAFDPLTNQLLASNDGTNDGLYSIDSTTLTASLIYANPDGDVDGLAAANGIAYLVNDNDADGYVEVDIATGTVVGGGTFAFNTSGAFSAGAFAPGLLPTAIPEPGTLGFLAFGAAAAMFRRRR